MTEHNFEQEQIGWLLDYHQFWDFKKIKAYGKLYGITEISVRWKNGEVITFQI